MAKSKAIFITATDTGVGKTIVTYVLGVFLKSKGYLVGVMKPVQCAGEDAQFLKKQLKLNDDLKLINPVYAPAAMSPHLALERAQIKFDRPAILKIFKILKERYDILLIEGAGGLMVPLTRKYYNADLIADLKAEVIIVSRLGLGTINHTLLTVQEVQSRGLKIKGIIYCQTKAKRLGLIEQSNPGEIEKLSGVKTLGIIPYLKSFNAQTVLRRCKNLELGI